jgi:aminopeptidase N
VQHHPSEINEIFDTISYAKGASVLRMLNDTISTDKFRAGLRVYLQRHKWGNTLSTDLWKALSETSGIDVANLMNTWLKRTGVRYRHSRSCPGACF